ncbi:hypothetical protein BKA62DRAFT_760915 [Auriculariales sp. MPI-PUGE-AT-0066]|nr:hypothetical protein BKA62DRAFT_760915 [Auriculariales sp. MPI-PUGE-AT-0066]
MAGLEFLPSQVLVLLLAWTQLAEALLIIENPFSPTVCDTTTLEWSGNSGDVQITLHVGQIGTVKETLPLVSSGQNETKWFVDVPAGQVYYFLIRDQATGDTDVTAPFDVSFYGSDPPNCLGTNPGYTESPVLGSTIDAPAPTGTTSNPLPSSSQTGSEPTPEVNSNTVPIAIGVSVAVTVIIIGALVFLLLRRRRYLRQSQHRQDTNYTAASPVLIRSEGSRLALLDSFSTSASTDGGMVDTVTRTLEAQHSTQTQTQTQTGRGTPVFSDEKRVLSADSESRDTVMSHHANSGSIGLSVLQSTGIPSQSNVSGSHLISSHEISSTPQDVSHQSTDSPPPASSGSVFASKSHQQQSDPNLHVLLAEMQRVGLTVDHLVDGIRHMDRRVDRQSTRTVGSARTEAPPPSYAHFQ